MIKKMPPPLENAAKDLQLAVDLIYLLETNDIEPHIVLKALDIVKNDYLLKSKQPNPEQKTRK